MSVKDKILTFLKLHSDKFWHFLGCFILSAFFTSWLGLIAGLILGITLGIGKELWDKWSGKKFDLWDLGADILGTILGVLIVVK
jgi:hypothetical protein